MSQETKDIAAGVAAGMLGEAAGKGMRVAPETIEALRENATPEAPEDVTEAPVAVQDVPEVDTRTPAEKVVDGMTEEMESPDNKFIEMPDFQPVPDEEFAAFDEEEALEDVSEAYTELQETEDLDVEDLDMDEIKRRLHKAEKALEHQRRLRERQQVASWRSEAGEKYPLADVESIQASSRNAFLKAAARSHNQMYTRLEPKLKELNEYKKALAEQTREEERAKAAQDWGKATIGHTPGDVDVAEYEKELDAARRTGQLEKILGVKRKFGRYSN